MNPFPFLLLYYHRMSPLPHPKNFEFLDLQILLVSGSEFPSIREMSELQPDKHITLTKNKINRILFFTGITPLL